MSVPHPSRKVGYRSSRSGIQTQIQARIPRPRHERVATSAARRRAGSNSRERAKWKQKAPCRTSPAPSVSTASIWAISISNRRPRSHPRIGFAPRVTATCGTPCSANQAIVESGSGGRPGTENRSLQMATVSSGANLFCSGLPASAIQNQHRSGLAAGGEYRQSLVEMETIRERHGRNLSPGSGPTPDAGSIQPSDRGGFTMVRVALDCIEKHRRQGCFIAGAAARSIRLIPSRSSSARTESGPWAAADRASSARLCRPAAHG